MARMLLNIPPKAKRGEVILIRSLISHVMENGFRHDNTGQPVPRDIITALTCTYNGETVFEATLYPAIAANPFVTFYIVASESGDIVLKWIGDNGFVQEASAKIVVE